MNGRYDQCGAEQPRYRSRGDRHCPQCQSRATEASSERQRANQLRVPYFHVVFPLPHRRNPWVQSHPEVIYRALFHAVWATLNAFGRDPKRLGGQLGMTGVLHTWGQSLCQHVHLHCLVPGGALAKDGTWAPVKGSYLFRCRDQVLWFAFGIFLGSFWTYYSLVRRPVNNSEANRETRFSLFS